VRTCFPRCCWWPCRWPRCRRRRRRGPGTSSRSVQRVGASWRSSI